MSRRVIAIARPAADSVELADAVRAAGFEPLVEPVLSIVPLETVLPDITPETPIIFSSSNGVQAYAALSAARTHPVYVVGRNTADEARRAGFGRIETAAGSADDLVEILLKSCAKDGPEPLYVRGEDISKDLKAIVGAKGLRLRESIVYRSVPAESLTLPLLRAIDNKTLFGIMFFSAKGGRVFCDLIEQYDRAPRMRTTKALCISEGVLQSVSVLPFGGSLIAETPDRYGMIKILEDIKR